MYGSHGEMAQWFEYSCGNMHLNMHVNMHLNMHVGSLGLTPNTV